MSKRFILVFFLGFWSSSFAQYTYEYDTLSINDRMHGSVDSTDVLSGNLPTTFDGGIGILSAEGFSLNRLNNDFGGQRFNQQIVNRRLKFSALPFIGFSYSFGGQGTQFIRAQYAQSFTDSLVLNVDYAGNIGNGYLRSSTFRSNQVSLDLEWKEKRYTLQFSGDFFTDSLDHSGGIEIDTALIENFGLEFSPVRKSNAAAKNTFANAALTNYFHFNAEAVNRFGLLTRHQYSIKYRAYHEFSDTLSTLYNQINIDSTTTYDRSNLASVQNSIGAFFVRDRKYIDFQIGHRYWSNLNLGNDFDTTEIDLESNLRWDFGPILLTNKFKKNLVGGFGALSEEACIHFRQSKLDISGKFSIDRVAPVPLQRSFYGNNYSYKLDEIKLEDRLMVGGRLAYFLKGDSIFLGAGVNSLAIRNAYIFEDTMWNKTGALNALQISAFGQFEVGKFNFHPKVIYSIEPNSYLPQVQANARIYFKSTVFKAKKLLLLIGLDGSFTSSYQPRNFISSMDAYSWEQSQNAAYTKGMVNAHFFTTIEISTFRFFVRYENIGYFWNEKTISEYNGYPIASQRIRLGLAWSFFN